MKRLCLLLALAAFFATPATAQEEDPPPTPEAPAAVVDTAAQVEAAREAAEAWLAYIDDADYEQSWAEAAEMFKEQVSSQQWSTQVEQVVGQIGALQERTLAQTQYVTGDQMPNLPEGEYVALTYRSQFDSLPAANETVVMAREGEAWKSTGYVVRPAQGGGQ